MGKKGRKTKQTQKQKNVLTIYDCCLSPFALKKHYLLKIGNGAFLSVPPIGMHFNIEYCFNGEYPEKIPRTPQEHPESTLLKIGWRRMDVIVHHSSKNTW